MQELSPAIERSGDSGSQDCDVIVFGGGPAGAAGALALAQKGLSVALFTKPRKGPAIGETVPPQIKRLLAQLGVWQKFLACAHAEAPGIVAIWGDERPYENDFLFNPYGSAWHLDRERFDVMLLESAAAAGVAIHPVSSIHCTENPKSGWSVTFGEGNADRVLNARWALDATGRSAWFARRFGATRHRFDRLVALVRFASIRDMSEPRTLIETCECGWWYAAALPRNRGVFALFTDLDLLPRDARARARTWDLTFGKTKLISTIASTTAVAAPIHIVSAGSGRTLPCAGRNWLAVGDATQFHDPLYGQGICRAIASSLLAAEVIFTERSGGSANVDGFVDHLNREFQGYLKSWPAYYEREQRWSHCIFWKRRHDGAHVEGGSEGRR